MNAEEWEQRFIDECDAELEFLCEKIAAVIIKRVTERIGERPTDNATAN